MRPQTSRLLILLLIPSLLVAGRKKDKWHAHKIQTKKKKPYYRWPHKPAIDPIKAFLAQKAKKEKSRKNKKKK